MRPFNGTISSKLPNTGTSIFAHMSGLAQQHNAINLAQGFPGFDCSPQLKTLVKQYMDKGYNQYAPMPGVLALREVIAEKMASRYAIDLNVETEVTVTAGATQALFTAITAIVKPGDEVIVFTPAYDCYIPAIELCGGIVKPVDLIYPDYQINWATVKGLISEKTKAIIINTPHNPSSTLWCDADMQKLISLVKNTNIIVISDEVYEAITFDGKKHLSVLNYPELAERSFVIYSFGKVYHNTGWKTGYAIAPKVLSAEFRKIHQHLVFSVNTPVQYALADFMKNDEITNSLSGLFQQKRNLFLSLLNQSKFEFTPAEGTYFQLLNYKLISDEPDTVFAEKLTINHGVAAIPLSVFYADKIDSKTLRFCFAKTDDELERAAERLCKI